MTVNEFTADENGLSLIIDHTSQPVSVDFYLSDNSKVNVSVPSVSADPLYTYVLAGDYIDGVYTAVINPGEIDEETAAIVNMTNGVHFLLSKVLRKEYDSRLMQELEAVKYYTLLQNESLLRSTYDEIKIRVAECEVSTEALTGAGIHIVGNQFITR